MPSPSPPGVISTLMCRYVIDFEQGSSSSQKQEHCAVLGKLMETCLKHIEKNKGGLKIPLSIPQIHLYVDSGLTGNNDKILQADLRGL